MTDNGLKFLMSKEGCRTDAYWDATGKVWTIGYGNTYWADGTPVKQGDKLSSNADALALLKAVVPKFEASVRNSVTAAVYDTLTDGQKDALTSLTYNIGGGNFQKSTVCKRVKANKNDRTIKDAFMMWNKSGGQVLKGLVTRRAEEAAMYFNEPVEIPNIDLSGGGSTTSTSSGTIVQTAYDPNFGDDNMFYELSHSSDWTVTPFKKYPRRSNNWSPLVSGSTCPKVGDILFAFHDGVTSGQHHHVAIYMGMHDGKKYVAEGKSRRGSKIYEATNSGVQVSDMANSRLALDGDIITHFAHCNKISITQTDKQASRVGLASVGSVGTPTSFNNTNYSYTPAVGEENMKHFNLIDEKQYRYKAGNSSLIYSNTAHSNNLSNAPTQEHRQNLVNLVNYLLDPLYEAVEAEGIGKLFASSGYRSQEVNAKIPGAEGSQHMKGQAADIQITGCKGSAGNALLKVAQLLLTLEQTSGFSYDQMILEGFNSNDDYQALRPVWLHLSFKSKSTNRTYKDVNKLLSWKKSVGYKPLTPEQVLSKPTT